MTIAVQAPLGRRGAAAANDITVADLLDLPFVRRCRCLISLDRGDAKRLRPHATAYRRDKLENVTEVAGLFTAERIRNLLQQAASAHLEARQQQTPTGILGRGCEVSLFSWLLQRCIVRIVLGALPNAYARTRE
jgi:hypothetical protein